MKNYLEVTGQEIINAAKGCGDIEPIYYREHKRVRINIQPKLVFGENYHEVKFKHGVKWYTDFLLPEKWFKKLKEVKKDG